VHLHSTGALVFREVIRTFQKSSTVSLCLSFSSSVTCRIRFLLMNDSVVVCCMESNMIAHFAAVSCSITNAKVL